jgi:hypothetical protein
MRDSSSLVSVQCRSELRTGRLHGNILSYSINPDHAPKPVRQAGQLVELGGTPEETESIGLSNETSIPCRYRLLPPSPPVRLAGWTSVLARLRRRIA